MSVLNLHSSTPVNLLLSDTTSIYLNVTAKQLLARNSKTNKLILKILFMTASFRIYVFIKAWTTTVDDAEQESRISSEAHKNVILGSPAVFLVERLKHRKAEKKNQNQVLKP